MVFKVVAIIAVLFIVYLLFFKRSREKEISNNKKRAKENKIEEIMEECPTCKTYISKKEAILSNGKYFCSKECLK
jgi:uncharacterized protein